MSGIHSCYLFVQLRRLGVAWGLLMTLQRKRTYHIIAIALVLISVLFSIFRFGPVANRIWQSIKDLGLSFAYYATKILYNVGWLKSSQVVHATVAEIPPGLEEVLPFEWDVFVELFEVFLHRCFSWDYFKRYLVLTGEKIGDIAADLLLVMMPFCALFGVMAFVYSFENTDHNQDSGALKAYKWIERHVLWPTKRFIAGFFKFVKGNYYKPLLLLTWAWNLSVITIALGVVAWLFYFSASVDFSSLYVQFVKLVCDLSVPAFFLPAWVRWLIYLKVFDVVRRSAGRRFLRAKDAATRAFLELYSWSILIIGKQRAKKSTLLTYFKRLLERIFRDKAQEKFFIRDMQFPNFPWIYVELLVKRGHRGSFATLEQCKGFVRTLRYHFENRNKYTPEQKRQILRHLRHRYGYGCQDFIFEYDYGSYGLDYNNGTVIVNIFDSLEKYVQLFKIYNQRNPLDISNISIREDITWDDLGNFPKKDDDFYTKKAENVKKDSQYSHRMNYDAFRPGKTFDENNPENNAVEHAIGVMDEADKERKNMLTKRGLKSSSGLANQENDLFETDTKMRPGHAALVDFYPFFRWLMASQRAGSLGADNRDMTIELYIKSTSDAKIALPFFAFEEALYMLSTSITKDVYYFFRHLRGDNTLLVYLLKKMYKLSFDHYWRVFNEYSYYVATVRVSDSQDGEVLESEYKIAIPGKVVYAEVFASDSYNGYYGAKARRSTIGLEKIPMYESIHPTMEELQAQNSYFIEDISVTFGVERSRSEQDVETQDKKNA